MFFSFYLISSSLESPCITQAHLVQRFLVKNFSRKSQPRLVGGEAVTKGLKQKRLLPDGVIEVREGDSPVPVPVHLPDRHLHEVPHPVPVLLLPLRPPVDEAVLHHCHDLLLGDVPVLIQIIDIKTKLDPLILIPYYFEL